MQRHYFKRGDIILNKKLKTLALSLSIFSILSINAHASTINEPMSQEEKQEYIKNNPLPEEQKDILSEKRKLADEHYNSIKMLRSWGGAKTNRVGTNVQSNSYYCDPASAQNLIQGYISTFGGGSIPTQATLAGNLYTTTSGTDFTSRWSTVLDYYAPGNKYTLEWINSQHQVESNIIWTIYKSYNVILDLNHNSSNPYPIHPQYAGGIAHYVVVYGYNDPNKTCSISDSNGSVRTYSTGFRNAYYSGMGMVW